MAGNVIVHELHVTANSIAVQTSICQRRGRVLAAIFLTAVDPLAAMGANEA
jgi:hypothetical protein